MSWDIGYGRSDNSADDVDVLVPRLKSKASIDHTTRFRIIKFCPMCGHALASGYKYCPKCGQEVAGRKRENQCSCGAIFEPGEKFCFSCGKPVPQKSK